ncbi:MAG: C25 family cysteine peptidase [Bacteroidia bacterium]|nr:C25 family cysteine peptidase [Bacteroidia bacterium]
MRLFKLHLLIITGFVFISSAYPSDLIYTGKKHDSKNDISLVSGTKSGTVLNVKVNCYSLKEVLVDGKKAFVVESPGCPRIQSAGAPDLPKLVRSVIIPDNAEMQAEVISSEFIEIYDIDIAPSKGVISRNTDPSSVAYMVGIEYAQNRFYPENIAQLDKAYILRDFRGQTVVINAFQYNPVKRVLRIYTDLVVKISARPGITSSENVMFRNHPLTSVDKEFDQIYQDHFINYAHNYKYIPVDESGKILVICYDSFLPAMQPYVDWKILKGIPTEIFPVSTIGTTAAEIKSFIANEYQTKNIKYVLLVGDAAQIPTNTYTGLGGSSDNAYGYISGNDHYAELFVGRFSAEDTIQVATQVQKVIDYEKYPSATSTHWSKSIGIASALGPGDDNEYDYQHVTNMQNLMLGYTYTYSFENFDGSQAGNDAAGDATAAEITNCVNDGGSVILYCGHGAQDAWGTSGFSNADMPSLTNVGKLPFIWSVACVNGEFDTGTCFAEAWLRATHNGSPSGAVATLMSTINQSWSSPMEGQDHMVNLLVESVAGNIKRTFGGLSINGLMDMIDAYGTDGENMADTWTIFGDPSLMVYTKTPDAMTVSHPSVVPLGTTQLTVNCNTDGALVSLTLNGSILNTGIVAGNSVNIVFPALTTLDTVYVTVTAYNKLPYFGTVAIIPVNGPYINLNSYLVNDAIGNNNQLADFGENISLDLQIENLGVQMAQGVNATISSTDTFINITNNSASLGNVDITNILSFPGVFGISIANDVPDQHAVTIPMTITDNASDSWPASINLVINAPLLKVDNITFDDSQGGNGNHRFDPGEAIVISNADFNNGHAVSGDAICTLTCSNPYITIVEPDFVLGTLGIASSTPSYFIIIIDPSTPTNTAVDLTFTLVAGSYSATRTVNKKVGLTVEDWESGGLTSYPWQQSGTLPWVVTNDEFFEGNYAAHSGAITDSQNSILSITIQASQDDSVSFYRKVSCEQGVAGTPYTWYDNLEFFIDNISNGKWDGEQDWLKVIYPVTAGTHTLKWIYTKDEAVSTGQDRAWIDFIQFPSVASTNNAPVFTSLPDTLAHKNCVYTYQITATDADAGDVLTLTCVSRPDWLTTFSDNGDGTAILQGTPTDAEYGLTFSVVLSVSDGHVNTPQLYYLTVTYGILVPELAGGLKIEVFPNPTTGMANISFSLKQASLVNLGIYNMPGELVLPVFTGIDLENGNHFYTVDTRDLSPGIYFINLNIDGVSHARKIVIDR